MRRIRQFRRTQRNVLGLTHPLWPVLRQDPAECTGDKPDPVIQRYRKSPRETDNSPGSPPPITNLRRFVMAEC
ncbi:uncharacterized protein PY1_contig-12-6 [Novosphingobium sp. PY1]|nr:uncharacterized protein PY1_contig-12-6 [Novosphingobium sp. PY1]